MGDADARRLLFHGAAVLLVGLLAGIPYSTAITGGWGPDAVRAWQKAHLGIVAGGSMVVAVAGAGRYLTLGRRATGWLVGSLAVSAWAAVVGLGGGALLGVQGLVPTGPAANLVSFAGNTVLAVGSLIGVGLLVVGSRAGAAAAAR